MIPAAPNLAQLRRDRWIRFRIFAVACFLVLGFTLVTWRLVVVQIKRHDELSRIAAKMRQVHQVLPAHRGSVRDVNGELLAHDEQLHEVYLDKIHLKEVPTLRRRLALLRGTTAADLRTTLSDDQIIKQYHAHVVEVLSSAMQLSPEQIQALLDSKRPDEVVMTDVTDEQAAEWHGLFEKEQITGVYMRPCTRRCYPAKERLTLVLGDVNFDGAGAWGVEQMMEERLAGKPGERWIERDNRGRELPLYRGEVIEPHDGDDVYLTIDMQLQDTAESVLEQACLVYQPRKAVALITDPSTGSVLAMAARPHFNREDKSGMWRNIAVADPYEPGSTFKIVTLSAALDSGQFRLTDTIFCHNGFYEEPALKVKLRDDESFAELTIKGVLTHSSNIGTYKIAKHLGQDLFLDYTQRYGFGQRTGVGLPGERGGYVNRDHWTGTTFSRMAMGYEVSVTPLQMVMAYGAIANGGVLMKPRLIDRIVSRDRSREQRIVPEPVRQICTARTAAQMREALESVVLEGTGRRAQIPDVRVAGKTGTAQRYDEKLRRYPEGQYITSFVGFAPADDPKIACLVMLDDPKAPKSELYGGKVAAPLFAELVRETLAHLSIRNERPFKVRLAEKGGAE